MAITRSRLEFEDHFTQMPNAWLRDKRLSWRARGVLAGLMSHRTGWKTSVAAIARQGKEGRDAVASAVDELIEFGYLVRGEMQHGDGGKFAGIDYELCDPHTDSPLTDYPYTAEPLTVNPEPKKNKLKEDQVLEEQSQAAAAERAFDEAWKSWPKKDKRKPALTKFLRLSKSHPYEWLAEQVTKFGDAYASAGTDPQFVPGLEVWLNQERWNDPLRKPNQQQSEPPARSGWMEMR